MLALFTVDARVYSPLQGERQAEEFYRELFAATADSRVKVLDVYDDGESGVALRLRYAWTLTGGAQTVFECVDIFRYDAAGRIEELGIYYDPGGVRAEYDAAVKSAHRSPSHS